MSGKGSQNGDDGSPRARAAAEREARLKQALKANLARRKAQARARGEPARDKPGDKED